MEARIAVLVSGSGTNLQALLDDPVVRPHITLVLSDRPDAFSLDRARDAGVESAVIEPDAFPIGRTSIWPCWRSWRTAGSTRW